MAKSERMTERQVADLSYEVQRTADGAAEPMFLRRAYWKLHAEVTAYRKDNKALRHTLALRDETIVKLLHRQP